MIFHTIARYYVIFYSIYHKKLTIFIVDYSDFSEHGRVDLWRFLAGFWRDFNHFECGILGEWDGSAGGFLIILSADLERWRDSDRRILREIFRRISAIFILIFP